MSGKKKTSVSLDRETIKRLREIAKDRKRSVSFIVNEGLERVFGENRREREKAAA